MIHTGQNHTATLSDVFFSELNLRAPDFCLGVQEPDFARQIGKILSGCFDLFAGHRPDRLLILGDTNSALAAVAAARLGIPVFHMEAGNRCFDSRVPEEVNRRIVDHSSDILLPYSERSRGNLLREGFASQRVYVTGNPIYEVIQANRLKINASDVLARLQLAGKAYLLATLHRAENVDVPERLSRFLETFELLSQKYAMPLIVSTHPRTRQRLAGLNGPAGGTGDVRFIDPVGFHDFVVLEENARCVLSDSGTVQEECTILRVPSVILRDVTERPETLECGSSILTGADSGSIVSAVALVLAAPPAWTVPPEYLVPCVSDTVVRLLTGYVHGLPCGIA